MLVPCLPTWCCWPCHDFFTGLWTSMNWRSPWPALFTFGTAIEGLDFKNLSDWDFYQGQHSQCRPARLGPVLLGLYWTLRWWRPLLRRLICRLALPSPQCEARWCSQMDGWEMATWKRASSYEPSVSTVCFGPLTLDRLLVCACGILFLLAAPQNQHHTSTHYPQALAVRALGESLVKCSCLHIIFCCIWHEFQIDGPIAAISC